MPRPTSAPLLFRISCKPTRSCVGITSNTDWVLKGAIASCALGSNAERAKQIAPNCVFVQLSTSSHSRASRESHRHMVRSTSATGAEAFQST
jgi:hypothetical protein